MIKLNYILVCSNQYCLKFIPIYFVCLFPFFLLITVYMQLLYIYSFTFYLSFCFIYNLYTVSSNIFTFCFIFTGYSYYIFTFCFPFTVYSYYIFTFCLSFSVFPLLLSFLFSSPFSLSLAWT